MTEARLNPSTPLSEPGMVKAGMGLGSFIAPEPFTERRSSYFTPATRLDRTCRTLQRPGPMLNRSD